MVLVLEDNLFVVTKHLQAPRIDQQSLRLVLGMKTRSLPHCPGRPTCSELGFISGKHLLNTYGSFTAV